MANEFEAWLRVVAWRARRAIPKRATSALAPVGSPVFGFAPIQIVAEQRTQAIAYGGLDETPQILAHWNALNREEDYLAPFAEALDNYLRRMIAIGELPQIWFAHASGVRLFELLGHRYRRNRNSSDLIRRLGQQCYALAMEAQFEGQQVLVSAVDLLREHVVTGQSPVEDQHLGALLAWIDPPSGSDPVEMAQRAALAPAAAMLERADDDRVEGLRAAAKGSGAAAQAARAEISMLLERGARREWQLLVDANRAFLNLGLPPAPGIDRLAEESFERISYALDRDLNSPSRPHSLARRLDSLAHSQSMVEDIDLCGDRQVREQARRGGRVVEVEVVAVNQPRRNFRPCTLTLRVTQPVMRVRSGTKLKTTDGVMIGSVRRLREEADRDSVLLELVVDKGFRAARYLVQGTVYDLVDTVIFDARARRSDAYRAMREAGSPLVYGSALPEGRGRILSAESLLGAAARLRRE